VLILLAIILPGLDMNPTAPRLDTASDTALDMGPDTVVDTDMGLNTALDMADFVPTLKKSL
jgi:hypothetical protein